MHPKHPQIQFPQSLLGPTPSNLDSPTACRAPREKTKYSHDSQPRVQLLSQSAASGHRRVRLIRVGRGPLILLEHLEKTAQRVNQFAARNTAFPELNA